MIKWRFFSLSATVWNTVAPNRQTSLRPPFPQNQVTSAMLVTTSHSTLTATTVQTVTCATVGAFFALPCCWPSYFQHRQLGRVNSYHGDCWYLLCSVGDHLTLNTVSARMLGRRDYSYLSNCWCLLRLLCQFVGSVHNQRCDIQAAFKLQNKHPATFITTTRCQQDKLAACTHTHAGT